MILKKQSGVAIVEFAIISVLLFTILFGIISYGFFLYDLAVLNNAVREGARAGVVTSVSGLGYQADCATWSSQTSSFALGELTATCVAKNYTTNTLISLGSTTPVTITASSTACATGLSGCPLTVSASYTAKGIFLFTSRDLKATSTMYYE